MPPCIIAGYPYFGCSHPCSNRLMKRILIWLLVAIWMLEELLWDVLNWIEERIAFLRLVWIIEQWVAARTPWQAAVLMLTPEVTESVVG